MGVLNIRPVVRGGSKVIIGIAGVSGSGKTYTALQIARGMVSKPSEIGFLDTENKRGSLYADILDGQFLIGDLYAPFSPKRYAEAIKEFQDAGVKVLVIDSVSHEWEGEGGCDDIANAPLLQGKLMANWKGAKSEHKKFMNALLFCDMHVICCIRAREKTDFKNPSKPVSLGIQPVCEKNFMFELTASVLMENEGKKQTHLKVPSFLKKSFGEGNTYLGVQLGKDILQWVSQGEQEDTEVSKCKSEMLMECEKGLEALTVKFRSLTPDMQLKMKPHMGVYKESAIAFDEQRKLESNSAVEVALDAETQRVIDSMAEIQNVAQLEASKGSFDLSNPVILEAYNKTLNLLSE
jgi:hypothetical protein